MAFTMVKKVLQDLGLDIVVEIFVKVAGFGITQTISLAAMVLNGNDEEEAEKELIADEEEPQEIGPDDADGSKMNVSEDAKSAVNMGKQIMLKLLRKVKSLIRATIRQMAKQG